MHRSTFLATALLLALAACRSGPDYAPPAAPASKALGDGKFLRAGDAASQPAPARWWEELGDAQLDALVTKGLANAPAIAAAEARLRQARAGLAGTRSGLLPSGGASLLIARAELPGGAIGGAENSNISLFNAGFDAQWEVDLWDGKRRDVERSAADAGAAEARLADAQVALSTEIARTYVAMRGAQARLALLDERRGVEDRMLDIARQRFAGGTAARPPIEAAGAELDRTTAELAGAQAEVTALTDALSVLTGEAPGALDGLPAAAIPLPPRSVAVGDPSALLARRPDIRAAERQLAAASAKIGIEKARRLPSVSLLGLIGIGGTKASDVFDLSNISTIALPRLSWNFLDFGRGAAAVRGAEAGRDAALADYRGQVLSALQDAEAALVRYGATRIALSSAASGASHAGEIARLQALRGKAGTVAPSEVLEARRTAIAARLGETTARADLTQAYVALAKALGLGWQAGPGA